MHPEEDCKLLNFEYGFLCFLHLILASKMARSIEVGTSSGVDSKVNTEEEVHEEVDIIDVKKERIDADQ